MKNKISILYTILLIVLTNCMSATQNTNETKKLPAFCFDTSVTIKEEPPPIKYFYSPITKNEGLIVEPLDAIIDEPIGSITKKVELFFSVNNIRILQAIKDTEMFYRVVLDSNTNIITVEASKRYNVASIDSCYHIIKPMFCNFKYKILMNKRPHKKYYTVFIVFYPDTAKNIRNFGYDTENGTSVGHCKIF